MKTNNWRTRVPKTGTKSFLHKNAPLIKWIKRTCELEMVRPRLTFCMLGHLSCLCCCLLTFLWIINILNEIQAHFHSVNRLGSRQEPTFCWSRSWSKLFAKVIGRLARKELKRNIVALYVLDSINHIVSISNFHKIWKHSVEPSLAVMLNSFRRVHIKATNTKTNLLLAIPHKVHLVRFNELT